MVSVLLIFDPNGLFFERRNTSAPPTASSSTQVLPAISWSKTIVNPLTPNVFQLFNQFLPVIQFAFWSREPNYLSFNLISHLQHQKVQGVHRCSLGMRHPARFIPFESLGIVQGNR